MLLRWLWSVCLLLSLAGASSAAETVDGFTIVLATYERDALLPKLLAHLRQGKIPQLREIVLVWQNVGRELPDFLQDDELNPRTPKGRPRHRVPVTVRQSKRNSMNERFRPVTDWDTPIKTEAVMILDDDVVLTWDALSWGYERFLEANPRGSDPWQGRITGFSGREFQAASDGKLKYLWAPKKSYSMVLSNAAWFRREWLEFYWSSESQEMRGLRDYVDEVFNCDDFLINFVVSNRTRLPPLMLQPKDTIRTVKVSGLWNRAGDAKSVASSSASAPAATPSLGHFSMRPVCLQHYFDYFRQWATSDDGPHYPLVHTYASASQDLTDHARVMIDPNERWQTRGSGAPEPLYEDEPDEDDIPDNLETMTDDELVEWFERVGHKFVQDEDDVNWDLHLPVDEDEGSSDSPARSVKKDEL